MQVKARLVAGGFQSDSPMVPKEGLKILIKLVSNEEFELASMDIRVTFFQGKTLDRDVYMRPQENQKVEGYV